jgi:hypothetical protein
MNFKTTIFLLIALIVVGVVFVIQQKGTNTQVAEPEQPSSLGPKLFNVESGQVNGVTIVDSDGNRTVIHRDGAAWKMTEPVNSTAVDWQTQDLIRTLCDLRSQGRPESAPADPGLDHPRYIVDLAINDGKSVRLAIGNNAGVGDVMYARVNDGDVNLIDSSLAKSLKTAADDLRDKHLLPTTPADFKQVRITTPTQDLEMVKEGQKWKITQPIEMPGDGESISSLISTITGTEATEFVKSDSDELAFARFDHPTMRVWLSTDAPSTQPTTQPEPGVTLTIGSSDSLSNDHYFVQTSDGLVAKIAKSSLDSLQKTPLDLRDRDVVTVVPADVSKIALVKAIFPAPSATQATQPAPLVPRPTFTQLIVLTRRPAAPKLKPLGPSLPTSRPATQPTTEPPQSIWEFAIPSEPKSPVDDSKVDALLAKFDPFRADKYLQKAPDSRVEQRYVVTLETPSLKKYHVEIVRPANGLTPYAVYNGLKFEIATSMLDALDADFHKTP